MILLFSFLLFLALASRLINHYDSVIRREAYIQIVLIEAASWASLAGVTIWSGLLHGLFN